MLFRSFINGVAFLIPTLHSERGLDLSRAGLISAMPSFGMVVTLIAWGYVVDRVGERLVLTVGSALTAVAAFAAACVVWTGVQLGLAMGLAGSDIHHFWLALVMLGLGWNFLYVAGTSQLTKCYRPAERAKIQAFNDCMVFSCVALCSFIAGTVEQAFGWDWVLRGATVPIALIAVALIVGWRRERVMMA